MMANRRTGNTRRELLVKADSLPDKTAFVEAAMNDPSIPFPPGLYATSRTIEIRPRTALLRGVGPTSARAVDAAAHRQIEGTKEGAK